MAAAAAPISGQKLLEKLLKDREGELKNPEDPDLYEKLQQVYQFLTDHETASANDATHEVLEGFLDWWVGPRSTKRLAIVEDNTVDTLYKYMAMMYDMGVPMTLGEKRSKEFKLVQDIELRGTKEARLQVEELINAESKLFHLLGHEMGELYPKQEKLVVVVFDGSGINSRNGLMATTVRLVWPDVIVDKERAIQIMDYLAHKLKNSTDDGIKAMETHMQTFSEANVWKNAFVDSIYCGPMYVRMPLNDSVSMPPLMRVEKRAFKPLAVWQFEKIEGKQALHPIWSDSTRQSDTLESNDFFQLGCIRCPLGTPLTEWQAPTFKGEQRPRGTYMSGSNNSSGAAPSRTGSHVRVRTMGGSDGPAKNRGGPARDGRRQEEQPKTYEREFNGTVEEFREKMDKTLGSAGTAEVDDQGKFVWTQQGESGARIEFRPGNRRVYYIGKDHQCRSLLTATASFAVGVSDSTGRGTTNGSTRAASTRLGSAAGYGGSQVRPSQAFAPREGSIAGINRPSSVAACSASLAASAAAGISSNGSRRHQVPYDRVVCEEFISEAAGELTLAIGDTVTVQKDDEAADNNIDRWVYGENHASKSLGWFPLSHTKVPKEGSSAEGSLQAVPE
eukprot:TRINITY_DN4248_c0_g1_i1.p1 TRINITY_DN4248_c0_g1~~TRINITY_DN4248_c0_g1_i1.p1  ORF type:complete len:627 (+),score=114.76 TRINITY_DN4248_c0_g1_i1:31-1881(+)